MIFDPTDFSASKFRCLHRGQPAAAPGSRCPANAPFARSSKPPSCGNGWRICVDRWPRRGDKNTVGWSQKKETEAMTSKFCYLNHVEFTINMHIWMILECLNLFFWRFVLFGRYDVLNQTREGEWKSSSSTLKLDGSLETAHHQQIGEQQSWYDLSRSHATWVLHK